MTREEKIIRAKEMRAAGSVYREISAELGVAISTVGQWFGDPDGAKMKARKDRYRGTCKVCGGRTTGSEGRKNAPDTCRMCAPTLNAIWSLETVVDAMRRFHERHGRKPCATDFNPNMARYLGHPWRSRRFYEDGDYPHAVTVIGLFGSWNAAIEAAGFDAWDVGFYPGLSKPRGAHLAAEHPSASNSAVIPTSA